MRRGERGGARTEGGRWRRRWTPAVDDDEVEELLARGQVELLLVVEGGELPAVGNAGVGHLGRDVAGVVVAVADRDEPGGPRRSEEREGREG